MRRVTSRAWHFFILTVAALGCVDDPPGRDADGADVPDARPIDALDAAVPMCSGAPAGGCEEVVDHVDSCPTADEICQGVCGASYDCCHCEWDASSAEWVWSTLFIHCPPCAADHAAAAPRSAGGTSDPSTADRDVRPVQRPGDRGAR